MILETGIFKTLHNGKKQTIYTYKCTVNYKTLEKESEKKSTS
jgi:hypothetical protein